MLLKSFTILAALLFAWSVLVLGLPSRVAHDGAAQLVRTAVRQPAPLQRPDAAKDEKATLRHAILRDDDVRNPKGSKLREAMKRRLQEQSMT